MRRYTDEAAQARRCRDAWKSAVLSTLWLGCSGFVLLLLRQLYCPTGFGSVVILVVSLLELGAIIPVWILLKARLKEIEGGEEDAASQY